MGARQPEGPPPPPVVQKLRIRYAKRGRLRFTSHRDVARTLERALRRAVVPMGFSAGFSPHPKVSYIGASPTGVASEAEYFEIGLAERCDPDAVRVALDAALPPGLDVLDVVVAGPGSLAERVSASVWQIAIPGVDRADAEAAVAAFLAAAEVSVTRLTKDGRRVMDARAAVVTLRVRSADSPPGLVDVSAEATAGGCVILDLVVRHTTPAVRPDDVLTGLRQVGPLVADGPSQTTRLAQGTLDEFGGVSDPLAPDRAATAVVPEF